MVNKKKRKKSNRIKKENLVFPELYNLYYLVFPFFQKVDKKLSKMYIGFIRKQNNQKKSQLKSGKIIYLRYEMYVVGVLILCILLILVFSSFSLKNNTLIIHRNDLGEGDYEKELWYETSNGETGKIILSVDEKEYTKAEILIKMEECIPKIEKKMLAENESIDCVKTDLFFFEDMNEYPFLFNFQSNNTSIIKETGKLVEPSEESLVLVTCTISYQEIQSIVYFNLKVPIITENEKSKKENEIEKQLQIIIDQKKSESNITLPTQFKEQVITWTEEENSLTNNRYLFFIVYFAFVFLFLYFRVKKKKEIREKTLQSFFFSFTNKLLLYLYTGASIKKIFQQINEDLERIITENKFSKVTFLRDEILVLIHETDMGSGLVESLENMGKRIGLNDYLRLLTLLSESTNLGNRGLLLRIEEEVKNNYEEQRRRLQKRAEITGTRLLFPMMIFLIIVMIMIMIPAFQL